jgi:hypothetical protein
VVGVEGRAAAGPEVAVAVVVAAGSAAVEPVVEGRAAVGPVAGAAAVGALLLQAAGAAAGLVVEQLLLEAVERGEREQLAVTVVLAAAEDRGPLDRRTALETIP